MSGTTSARPLRMTALPGSASGVQLAADVSLGDSELNLHARVENKGRAAIYVLHELWRIGPDRNPVRDPERAYRSLARDTLRVLLGVPTLPIDRTVRLHMKPFAARVEPGGALDLRLGLPLPTREYNPYYTDKPETEYHDVTANAVELYVQLVTQGDGIHAQPAGWPWAAGLYDVGPAFELGGQHRGEFVAAATQLPGFRALRRVGDFARMSREATP